MNNEHTPLYPDISQPSSQPVPSAGQGMPASIQQPSARRHRLNEERKAITHKFQVGKHEGYITVGLYDDTRQPGEIFITMSKEGSMMSGLVDAFATSISIGLQYGVPLKIFVYKFVHMRFEPSGVTENPNIPEAKSIVDYVFRWLSIKFLTPEERQSITLNDATFSNLPAYIDTPPTLLNTNHQNNFSV